MAPIVINCYYVAVILLRECGSRLNAKIRVDIKNLLKQGKISKAIVENG
jgi:hypothetical protein